MMAIVGRQTGRVVKTGSGPWGRFAWTKLRGGRDEGILVISAYRVSKKGSKNWTQYSICSTDQ